LFSGDEDKMNAVYKKIVSLNEEGDRFSKLMKDLATDPKQILPQVKPIANDIMF